MNKNFRDIEYELRDLIKEENIETIKNRLKLIIIKLKLLKKDEKAFELISKPRPKKYITKKVGIGR